MQISKTRAFFGIQVFLWLALTVLTRLSWLGYEPPGWGRLFLYSALGLLYSSLLGAAFTRLFDQKIMKQMLLALLLTSICAVVWRATDNAIEFHILERNNEDFIFWGYIHNGRMTTAQMMVWATGFWAIFYYTSYTRQRHQAAAAQAQVQTARLKLLQSQINPHFLFNTLGGVDTLLLKNSVDDAREMLGKLTDYLRQSLENEPATEVPLELEVERAEGYLEIEKIRVGDRLRVLWHLPEPLPDVRVPTGILLPLVENAIKHGAINSRAGGYVDVAASVTDDHLLIKVKNDTKPTSDAGFGIGLSNTKDRLETLYGDAGSFSVTETEKTFTVTLGIPKSNAA